MLELIDLIEKSSATIHADLRTWFGQYPAVASWSIVSDFNVGDTGKQNDAYSFVIVLKHDTDENIAFYIAATSPSDPNGSFPMKADDHISDAECLVLVVGATALIR